MPGRVLIAGGGVAALEAALALRAVAAEPLEIELLAAEPHFWYRPLSVAEPFRLGEARRFELGKLAAAMGATFSPGRLLGVDVPRRVARTSVGDLSYHALLVSVGALPEVAVRGALTFRGPADTDKVEGLLGELGAGAVSRVAFVAPAGASWPLPVYELALLTAAHLDEKELDGVELIVVTPEPSPLDLFGRTASEAVSKLLDEIGIELVASAAAREFLDSRLRLESGGSIHADRVVALPRLRGQRLDGLPQTLDRFIPIDRYGRVPGAAAVHAAGDITTFPIKQGGISAQLADVAARSIASQLGVAGEPEPFRPVLRGLLLTGRSPRYLRHDLTGARPFDGVSAEPLWWPPAKIVGRHLAPFLAGLAGDERPVVPAPAEGAVEVEVELRTDDLDNAAPPPRPGFLAYRQAARRTRGDRLGGL